MTDAKSEKTFQPVRPNPYIVGNPVRNSSMFFGRETEFELVRKRFSEASNGMLLVFCGERRSGKTSILFQIENGRLGPDFIPTLIDMQSMSVESEARFLQRVAAEMVRALPSDTRTREPGLESSPNPASAFYAFVERVLHEHAGKKPILLVDEYELFEDKIEAGTLTPDILSVLAGLMEKHPFFMVFTGSQPLEERKREYWQILGRSIYRRISYLQQSDAYRLIQKPVAGTISFPNGVLERIYRLASGQPFYIQAICQNLIDYLNDHKTNVVTLDDLENVLHDIVDNPLPQMIFLWDGFERDEKLVLALLAQVLSDSDSHATISQVVESIKSGGYPLSVDHPTVATVLDRLFEREFLLKTTSQTPGYAFRMDLWRLWVHRMHSVWQVMREEGMDIRRRPSRSPILRSAWTLIPVIVLGLFGLHQAGVEIWPFRPNDDDDVLPPDPVGVVGRLWVRSEPTDTELYIDGMISGVGALEREIPAGLHTVRAVAAGYYDTTLTVSVEPDSMQDVEIVLRPKQGSIHINTTPTGARVEVSSVDPVSGSITPHSVITSPNTVSGLVVPAEHQVLAQLKDHRTASQRFKVLPDTTISLTIALQPNLASFVVLTSPPAARLSLDGRSLGPSPHQVHDLPVGRYRFSAVAAGYVSRDTVLQVTEDLGEIRLRLDRIPPAELVVSGTLPADIYLNGSKVAEDVPHFGPNRMDPGIVVIECILASGETISDTITVSSSIRSTYNYMERRLVSEEPLEN